MKCRTTTIENRHKKQQNKKTGQTTSFPKNKMEICEAQEER